MLMGMTSAAEHPWGRVDADGTVYVRTADGERVIGQWPGGDPQEAMALYVRRFEGLEVEVDLLEKRLTGGTLGPDDAEKAVATVREQVTDAQALGDLDSLLKRLDELAPAIAKQREERKAARAAKTAEALTTKTRIAEDAEKIAAGSDWRGGADALRALLDEWKSLARLDRKTDDELWHRFSSARTTYTRHRKAHFAEQNVQREAAQSVKEKLIVEAEELSSSTDWGPTSGKYRDLMSRWKAAGSAPRNVEDKLWKQFRAAQDVFFTARDEAERRPGQGVRGERRRQGGHPRRRREAAADQGSESARRAWLEIADRWEAAGKVPRGRVKEMEGRLRKVEQAVREASDQAWNRTDPEKSARADDMIGKLQKAIDDTRADLEKAEKAKDTKKVKKLKEDLASRESFLEMAEKAQADFS